MNDRDLDRLLRAPSPDEPTVPRAFTTPAPGVVAVAPVHRTVAASPRRRPLRLAGAALLAVAVVAGAAGVLLPRVADGPGGVAPTPTLPAGVTVTRERAIAVVQANGGGGQVIDARVGRIGDFDPNQRLVPADRLVWAITFSDGNSSTDLVDAATGEWLEGMSPAPAAIIGSLSTGLPTASFTAGPTTVVAEGLVVPVPDGWRFYAMSQVTSFTSVSGVLANFDLDAACGLPSISGGCLQALALRSGQALVFTGGGGFPGWTLDGMRPVDGWTAFIGGMPAARTVTTGGDLAFSATELRRWEIARQDAENNRYTIDAYLGPDAAALARAVDAIATGITFVAPVVPLPTGDAVPAAKTAAVVTALRELVDTSAGSPGASWYACFPTSAGVSRQATITDTPGVTLTEPLAVTCRTDIASTDAQTWHLVLTVSWPGTADHAAGAVVSTVTLMPGGSVIFTTTEGDTLPGQP